MSRKYVSTEFNCWRIFVIAHRSASIKLAVDSLVLFVSGLRLIRRRGRKSVWQIVSSQRFKLFKLFICTQLYALVSFGPQLSKQLFHRMSLITRNAKGYRSMTVQLLLGGPNNRHGHHYPTIPCGPMFKQIELFFFGHIDCIFQL